MQCFTIEKASKLMNLLIEDKDKYQLFSNKSLEFINNFFVENMGKLYYNFFVYLVKESKK